jgi:hypothetical protein
MGRHVAPFDRRDRSNSYTTVNIFFKILIKWQTNVWSRFLIMITTQFTERFRLPLERKDEQQQNKRMKFSKIINN